MPMNARLLRPRATGFNPKSIAGLSLWLDASDASTLRQNSDGSVAATANGDPVGYWGDKSGNNHHLTQATAGLRGVVFTSSGRTRVDIPNTLNAGFASATSPTTSSTATVIQAARFQGAFGNWLTLLRGDGSAFFDAASSGAAISPNLTAGSPSYFVQGLPTTATRAALYSALNEANAVLSVTNLDLSTWSSGWRYYNFGSSFQFTGEVGEVLVYNRALTASERQRIEAYLARKWSISLPPQVSNSEAQDWVNRVYANGGSVSASTASAVNTFCNAIDTAGIRDRFYRLNLLCGNSDAALVAPRVPLYRGPSAGGTQYGNTIDTNLNFVAGDYAETGASGGLTGNGSTKALRHGVLWSALPDINSVHLAAYTCTAGNSGSVLGAYWFHTTDAAQRTSWELFPSTATVGSTAGVTFPSGSLPALLTASRVGSASSFFYRGATASAESTVTGSVARQIESTVFARNLVTGSPPAGGAYGETLYSSSRIGGYSLGAGMSGAQVTAYNNAMQAFQTALARNA